VGWVRTAAARVTRLATMARPVRWMAWARKGPATAALRRLAEALDLRLVVALAPEETDGAAAPEVPPSLVRLGRTRRFRQGSKRQAARPAA
jgi:hypothetical protein